MSDITIYRGDDRTLELEVEDKKGVAVPLTGATIKFTVKKKATDPDSEAVIAKSSANPPEITITDAAGGIAEIYIVPADTKNINAMSYVYDVELTTSTGKVYTLLKATLRVLEDVTKGA